MPYLHRESLNFLGLFQIHQEEEEDCLYKVSKDYNPAFYATHVPCVNFTLEHLELQFKICSEQQIFEKFFMVIL